MPKLFDEQAKFSYMVATLIAKAHELGYQVVLGRAGCPASCTTGHQNSLHKKSLAIDINLFKNGVYLTDTEDHRQLGEWWESLGGSWGGRFNDGNHYSIAFGGMR